MQIERSIKSLANQLLTPKTKCLLNSQIYSEESSFTLYQGLTLMYTIILNK